MLQPISGSVVKTQPANEETEVWPLDVEDPLEKEMVTHSSILAWEIPWIEEPGRLQSKGSKRVGHGLAAKQEHAATKDFTKVEDPTCHK